MAENFYPQKVVLDKYRTKIDPSDIAFLNDLHTGYQQLKQNQTVNIECIEYLPFYETVIIHFYKIFDEYAFVC